MQVSPANVQIVKRTPTKVTIAGEEYQAEKRRLMIRFEATRPVHTYDGVVTRFTQSEPFSQTVFAETIEVVDPRYWEKYITKG